MPTSPERRLPRGFLVALLALLALAATLRMIYPTADPPWRSTVGVVWHDEGAWTHSARNKALYGAWVQDEWNPVYVAPVFTALEYLSFEAFGVGLRQARLVPALASALSVLVLALGVRRLGGDRAALYAGALIATNYVYLMYGRAAIMEALMTAFIVASWYCASRAEREPRYGLLAGAFAALAFFTKAAAAAYVAALGLVAVLPALLPPLEVPPPEGGSHRGSGGGSDWAFILSGVRRNIWILAGLAISFALVGLFFVLPHWSEYRFYNWQMSVTRKPSYDLQALITRVAWFPILHDTFSRMWGALCFGVLGAWSAVVGWRRAETGERLLVLWLGVGALELLVHDVGNERRFVFLIPAFVALAALVLARGSLIGENVRALRRRNVLLAAPVMLYCAYVLAGSAIRVLFLDEVYGGLLKRPVRLSAALAVLLTMGIVAAWPRVARLLAARWRPVVATAAVAVAVAWNLAQFLGWAWHRSYKNYEASVALGRVLPPGTLVQGKLANGLALDNAIRPIFIGHAFGNYADRKMRGDVRYILTYTDPEIGHEGDQIVDVLAAYPGWRIIMTFPVAETPSGHDRAALIDKRAGH